MCLPTTLRILNPANLFCNMQCTTVCITAAGSRVAKRTPGTCPGGVPQRVRATKTVGRSQRGGCWRYRQRGIAPATRRAPTESGEVAASQGVLEGAGKTEGSSGYAWATRGTPYMCRCARQRLVVGGFLGLRPAPYAH